MIQMQQVSVSGHVNESGIYSINPENPDIKTNDTVENDIDVNKQMRDKDGTLLVKEFRMLERVNEVYIKITNPKEAYDHAKYIKNAFDNDSAYGLNPVPDEILDLIAKDAYFSYMYATEVLKDKFELGKKVIVGSFWEDLYVEFLASLCEKKDES